MAKAPDAGGALRDDRLPPFCYQTHAALDAIRVRYEEPGVYGKLAVALGVYLVVTEQANRAGGASARSGFRCSRSSLAQAAGVSRDTFDRYVAALCGAGVLEVERQTVDDVNLPNRWVLVEPPPSRVGAATPPRGRGQGSRVDAAHRARDPLSEEETTLEERTPQPPAIAGGVFGPPPVWVDDQKRNPPLDALVSDLHIDPEGPGMAKAIRALNGTKAHPGIRHLFWVECRRHAEAHGRLHDLDVLAADPEQFARLLQYRIGQKVAKLRARDSWRTRIDPNLLRQEWLDLELSGPAGQTGGMTAAEMATYQPPEEGTP